MTPHVPTGKPLDRVWGHQWINDHAIVAPTIVVPSKVHHHTPCYSRSSFGEVIMIKVKLSSEKLNLTSLLISIYTVLQLVKVKSSIYSLPNKVSQVKSPARSLPCKVCLVKSPV